MPKPLHTRDVTVFIALGMSNALNTVVAAELPHIERRRRTQPHGGRPTDLARLDRAPRAAPDEAAAPAPGGPGGAPTPPGDSWWRRRARSPARRVHRPPSRSRCWGAPARTPYSERGAFAGHAHPTPGPGRREFHLAVRHVARHHHRVLVDVTVVVPLEHVPRVVRALPPMRRRHPGPSQGGVGTERAKAGRTKASLASTWPFVNARNDRRLRLMRCSRMSTSSPRVISSGGVSCSSS